MTKLVFKDFRKHQLDEISIRSSHSSVVSEQIHKTDTETIRSSEEEFLPREVRKIAKAQEKREAEKLKQIKENRTFADPEIELLLALLPVAKIKLR